MFDDLVAFYEARLNEEERLANAAAHAGLGVDVGPDGHVVSTHPDVQDHIATWHPARVLREVEAKREVLRLCAAHMNELDQWPNGLVSPRALLARQTIMGFAAACTDHPDYRPEWKP